MLKRAVVCLAVVFCLWAGSAIAADGVRTVSDVRIDGINRVDVASVEAALSIKAGQSLDEDRVDEDLRAIYALGHFKDVEASVEQQGEVVTLVYRVTERPLVRSIKLNGIKELKRSKVRGALTMRTPSILHPKTLQESTSAIRQTYIDEGYYAAEVSSRVDTNSRNEATVYFDITEGTKVAIDDITFEGNEVFSSRKLRGFMQTKEWWLFSWLTSGGTYNEAMLENDRELIKDAYFNEGYIRVRVKPPLITLSDDREEMDIHIEIDEGQQYYLGDMAVKGDLLEDESTLLGLLKFKAGDVFSREQLRKDIKRLNDYYADHGYAYVNVSPVTLINNEQRTVDVTFEIEQGVQVHIGRINIGGNTKTRDKVIRREMVLVEGDLYSASRLEASRKRVNNLGFFSEVNVDTVEAGAEEIMDVQVDVKEQSTGTFSVGFGYSSVDGFIGQGSISQDNFLGKAWRLNLAGSFGGDSTTYQLGLLDPYFMDKNLALGFDVYRTDREWDEYSREATEGKIKLGIPITYATRTFFIYKFEQKDIYDVDNLASYYIREQEGSSTLSSIYASISTNTTDYRPDPTSGYMSEVSVEFAGLGGSEKFVKTILDHRHFVPIKWGIVFSAHGQVGFVHKVGGEEIPVDERFYLGGINTMRGFENREVGPWEWGRDYARNEAGELLDENGDIYDPNGTVPLGYVDSTTERDFIGGVKEAFCNLELIFPLLKDAGLKGVVFFDIGNTWDQGEEFMSDLRYSTGVGIRWNSPLGPLRLEWGYNLDPEEYEDNSQFDFSIGKFF
ncbi:outer membrane protein assembly factor BamA [Desulfuromonas acetoxidans]|uniref:Outer membrane protein assembly factor BamA n=1 Tax=Desulfuromonas acetoxidans (strain DSM 684 / 11070) TaxID=281689 RepID=Q1K132_DESA6|nr:outer membrane protein assembly factor BamA [Desulfuromonas acetoxidans]EAT16176.1 surface antigen (D15) [Desulfuromonas acetoxidans DSM 684]NVD25471.1 outer membrane protein assembly factor BamA [Desulfuromonas acetoxidans]